jgi:signal transduction histidine kinase
MAPDSQPASSPDRPGRILVVDDDEINRQGMRFLLELDGHEVAEAEDGSKALAVLAEFSPDVVLSDVKMPEMDGFELCSRIKRSSETNHIPVLLLTGLRDRASRLQGIEAGASDFLTKPPDEEELKLRVRNALSAKQLFDELQDQYDRLRKLERMRDSLTHMIVHDLRSPAAAAQGYLEIFQDSGGSARNDRLAACIPKASACIKRLLNMVGTVLDVSRLESRQMELHPASADMGELVGSAVELAGSRPKDIRITRQLPESAPQVVVDAEVIQRVVTNLVSNAVKFTPAGGEVTVRVQPAGEGVRLEVQDTGPGIAPEYHEKIFQKFGQVEERSQGRLPSTGLGLTFCKLAVEAHGGRIGVESSPGEGSTFWVELNDLPAAGLES